MSKRWNGKVRVVYNEATDLYYVQSRMWFIVSFWSTAAMTYFEDTAITEAERLYKRMTGGVKYRVVQE